jgi:hypothetical protein
MDLPLATFLYWLEQIIFSFQHDGNSDSVPRFLGVQIKR